MPEGFNSIDDLKVAITASTEGLEAGLGSAKALVERFSADGTSSLARFDTGLAKAGAGVANMRGALLGWVGAAKEAFDALGPLMDRAEALAKTAGFEKEFGELKSAYSGLGESISNGLTAPLVAMASAGQSANASLADMAAPASVSELAKSFETVAAEAGKVDAESQEFLITMDAVAGSTGTAARSARDLSQTVAEMRAALGVPAAVGWMAEVTETIKIMRATLETFAGDNKKTTAALDGEIASWTAKFIDLRQRLESVRENGQSWVDLVFGQGDETQLIGQINRISERIAALQAERKSRPVVDPTTFDAELDAIDKQIEAVEQKTRLFGLAAGEAARLLAEEKALAAFEKEMGDLSEQERLRLTQKLDALKDVHDELTKIAAVDGVDKAIKGLNDELAQLELRTSLIGKSASEVARLTAEHKINALAKQKDIELTDEQTAALEENAAAVGRAAAAHKAAEASLATTRSIDGLADQATALQRQVDGYGMAAGAAAALAAEEKILADARRQGTTLTNAQSDAMQDELLRIEELTDRRAALDKERQFGRDVTQAEREVDAIHRKIAAMGLEAGAAAELTMQQKLLDAARRQGVEVSDTQRARITEIARAFGEATREAKALEAQMALIKDGGRLVANALTSAFDQWMRGTEIKGRELVANLLREMAKLTLIRTILEPGQSWLSGALGGLLGGGSGGGIGSWVTSSVPAMASGGTMSAGVPTLVGERGPELVMPLAGARVIPNHALGGLGGGGSPMAVNISIDARGATRDTLPALERELADLRRTLPRTILETVSTARDRRVID
jgi:hypothetical protein